MTRWHKIALIVALFVAGAFLILESPTITAAVVGSGGYISSLMLIAGFLLVISSFLVALTLGLTPDVEHTSDHDEKLPNFRRSEYQGFSDAKRKTSTK